MNASSSFDAPQKSKAGLAEHGLDSRMARRAAPTMLTAGVCVFGWRVEACPVYCSCQVERVEHQKFKMCRSGGGKIKKGSVFRFS